MEALREQQPVHEIAQRYQVPPPHRSQNGRRPCWGKAQTNKKIKDKHLQEQLYKNIGQLKVDFLKDSGEKHAVPLPQEYND